MKLDQLQAEQVPWVKRNFGGDRPSWWPLLGIVEEVGELCHAHLKHAQGIRTTENHQANKVDAVGDIIVYLADYCTAEGIDLQRAVNVVWAAVKQRDWVADPEHGQTIKAGTRMTKDEKD